MILKGNEWLKIESPVEGRVTLLAEVNDGIFSQEKMGLGVAVFPTNDIVVAPVDGKILYVFPTKHAVGIETEKGTELLIHVGIDTVKMNGEHFEAFVKKGDWVKRGDKLLQFPLDEIVTCGYNTAIPIVITNISADRLKVVKGGNVESGECIMEIEE